MNFWYWIVYTFTRIVAKLLCSYQIVNREAMLRAEGGLMIASNHVSFLDPPLVGIGFHQSIYYFARKTLFDHPAANWILTRINALPVNQDKPELSALRKTINLLKSGEKVVLFPEGERTQGGVLKEEGEPGIGMIVAKAKVPVLPVRLFGAEKVLPLGSKRVHRHPIVLVVGEPIDFSDTLADKDLKPKDRYQLIADQIMDAIRALELPDELAEKFTVPAKADSAN